MLPLTISNPSYKIMDKDKYVCEVCDWIYDPE